MPGCEKMDEFKNMELTDCCKSYPQPDPNEPKADCQVCSLKPEEERMCCVVDCHLNSLGVLNSTEFIDMEKMKEKLSGFIGGDPTWVNVITGITVDCTKEGKGYLNNKLKLIIKL